MRQVCSMLSTVRGLVAGSMERSHWILADIHCITQWRETLKARGGKASILLFNVVLNDPMFSRLFGVQF